jgi:transaldolase
MACSRGRSLEWASAIANFYYTSRGNGLVKVRSARWVLERLPDLGISIDNVTRPLEDEGVEKFDKPMETLAQRSLRHRRRES